MNRTTRRGMKEGIGLGIVAAIVFALAEVVVAAITTGSPLMPFRMFASVVMGSSALEPAATGIGTAFVVGSLVHLALGALFGLAYGLFNAALSTETQTSMTREAIIGLSFGIALWLVNFHIIARAVFPWFLDTNQATQMLLHALFYGLPLGVMYAGAERRAHHIRRAPATV